MKLPMIDRSKCTTCSTPILPNTMYAVWNSICEGSDRLVFIDQSRVTFEVFDNYETGSQLFLGGASMTRQQL